jgi:spore germination protein GerM
MGVLAVLASVVAGCGVGAQSEPHTIDRSDIPFGLAARAHETTTTLRRTTPSYTVYLVGDDRLRAVTRSTSEPLTPREVLARLVDGPSATEADAGLRTLLDPEVDVERVRVDGGVATIELSGTGTARPAGDDGALAVAQLVYTATALPTVERVRIEIGGRQAEIPRGDGTLTKAPVSRSDYPLALSGPEPSA